MQEGETRVADDLSTICTTLSNLVFAPLLQVEVYNMGMLLTAGSGTVTLQRGQAVQGRFTIPAPHEKVSLYLHTLIANIPLQTHYLCL